jgi:hypothetical protein|tara:strand:- start:20 stop:316 length:297 start_codon:yes stop_codon:yes gene_type:complete
MEIYNFIKIYTVTKSFYERIVDLMRNLSNCSNEVITDMAEFMLVLDETLIFIEDILESVDSTTEKITDMTILRELSNLLSLASELEIKLENYLPIYLN